MTAPVVRKRRTIHQLKSEVIDAFVSGERAGCGAMMGNAGL